MASPENIVGAAAANEERVVRAILEKHPDKVAFWDICEI